MADELLCFFAGPSDGETCDGCEAAVDGNPYTIDEAPCPGDFECMSRCRHILQVMGDAPDDVAPYVWSGSIGFVEPNSDEIDTIIANSTLGPVAADIADLSADEAAAYLDQHNILLDDIEDILAPELIQPIAEALDGLGGSELSLEDALADGDALMIEDRLKISPAEYAEAITLGEAGIEDEIAAYTLADALGEEFKVYYGNDALWYVTDNPDAIANKLTESLTEGGAGSGNFGHSGRPGARGGSAPNLAAHLHRVATIHELAQHEPTESKTAAAYAALKKETLEQYQSLLDKGVKFNRPRGRMKIKAREGGEGSGNFSHAGRPGEVGGSAAGGGQDTVTWRNDGRVEIAAQVLEFLAENALWMLVPDFGIGVTLSRFAGTLWHGTTKAIGSIIRRDGFHAGKNMSFRSLPLVYGPGIYLTDSKVEAEKYGEDLLKVNVEANLAKMSQSTWDEIGNKLLTAWGDRPLAGGQGMFANDIDMRKLATKSWLMTGWVAKMGYDGVHIVGASDNGMADYYKLSRGQDLIKTIEANRSGNLYILAPRATGLSEAYGNRHHLGIAGQRGGSLPGDAKEAVFMLGGAASGKGGVIAAHYQGYAHLDPDQIKHTIPLFTEKEENGRYGPSGPKTLAELQTYQPKELEATEEWVRKYTPYAGVKDFANQALSDLNKDGKGENFGGGLTHELSSAVQKANFVQELEEGNRSFVYDTTGSKTLIPYVNMAKKAGYSVTFHHVYLPEDEAEQRNLERPRTVPAEVLHHTHEKARQAVAVLKPYAKEHHERWRYTSTQ